MLVQLPLLTVRVPLYVPSGAPAGRVMLIELLVNCTLDTSTKPACCAEESQVILLVNAGVKIIAPLPVLYPCVMVIALVRAESIYDEPPAPPSPAPPPPP